MSVTVTTPGLMLTEHELSVPLDHARPDGERITVFAREVADPDGRDRPYLVYLQRGPGFEAPRPTRHPSGPGWLDRALQDYRERLLPAELREAPEFFTGEHVYPAGHEWPPLYDPARLAENEVPAAAAIYVEDMYVERAFSEETAAQIRGLRPWITSEYEHNGLRADGERVLGRLIELARGRA